MSHITVTFIATTMRNSDLTKLCIFLVSLMQAAYSAGLIYLDFVILIVFGKEYKL
jgi:hypothetical protein